MKGKCLDIFRDTLFQLAEDGGGFRRWPRSECVCVFQQRPSWNTHVFFPPETAAIGPNGQELAAWH